MSFLQELEEERKNKVETTNNRTIQTIKDFLEDKHPPIEEMKQEFINSSKNMKQCNAYAQYRINLEPLFTQDPPLSLYVTRAAVTNTAEEITFTKRADVFTLAKLERVFIFDKEDLLSQFEGITRIIAELKDAFPGAKLNVYIDTTSSYPSLSFTLTYNLTSELKPYFIG